MTVRSFERKEYIKTKDDVVLLDKVTKRDKNAVVFLSCAYLKHIFLETIKFNQLFKTYDNHIILYDNKIKIELMFFLLLRIYTTN